MTKIVFIAALCILGTICNAQVAKEKIDTLKVDSVQVEMIQKMPMDTAHIKNNEIKELPDSSRYPKTTDDVDPDKPKHNAVDPLKPKKKF